MISFLSRTILAAGVALLLGAMPAAAQSPLRAEAAFRLSAAHDGDGALVLRWTIAPRTYLYRESLEARHDGAKVELATPPGEEKDDPNFGRVGIYHGAIAARAPGLPDSGTLEVGFQGCAEDGVCYPPARMTVDLATLAVAEAPREAFPEPKGLGAAAAESGGSTGTEVAAAPPAPSPPGREGDAASLTGPLPALLAAFLGFGLLLAFTPCVFPMIPILSGILADGAEKSGRRRGFVLSSAYVLAMAAAYGVVGLAAGWSGASLQAALQTPLALGLMAAVLVALALSMFGLFDLALPPGLAGRLSGGGRGGSVAGAALLGFGSALVVGPCVTPPLAAALLYAAQTGDGLRGGAALFMLGLGMGLPLVAAGTFGARILPRSGPWLGRMKAVCGVMFLAVAVALAARLLPGPAGLVLWGALAVGVGVFAGSLDRMNAASGAPSRLGKAAGLVALLYGGLLIVGAAGGAGNPLRPLGFLAARALPEGSGPLETRISSPAALDAALAEAKSADGPVLVTFTAGWCTVCKSNEAVMAEPQVRARIARLKVIAADVTNYGAQERALMRRHDVVGPPTLFLMDAAGREVPHSRLIGPITPDDISALAAKAGL
ncbi:protein-disulfide reductase DsbD [Xanthobacter pseudotagetidis]|uniref:protein-disulfide reductase DsbD n=1 Tax=Xanthobacter pseudotagetidis TaxID=3119911 RepID=UPI0037296BF5